MSHQVVVRFLEHHTFVDQETGLAPGYKPVLIGAERAPGHVIDIDRMRKSQRVAITKAEIRLTLGEDPIDVSSHLVATPEGGEWLTTLQERYRSFSPVIVATTIPFTPLNYTLYKDGVINQDPFFRKIPTGIIRNPPKSALYLRLLPCVTDLSGEFLKPISYHGMFEGGQYSINELGHRLIQPEGVLLGDLKRTDFEYLEHEGEVEFPIRNYLQVSYPVALREAHKVNPLSLEIHLKV